MIYVDIVKFQLKLLCDGDYFHVHFCSHILKMIVKEESMDLVEVVPKVRECVKHCKGFQIRKQRVLESCTLCQIVHRCVKMS